MVKKYFHTIYFTGCSYTEGGGLNPPTLRTYKDDTIPNRTKLVNPYTVTGECERDNCYPTIVKNIININLVNEAACGGGVDRSIRKMYEYIESQSLFNLKQTIFFIELAPGTNRWDFYSNKLQNYLICNINYKDNFEKVTYLTEDYLKPMLINEKYFNEYKKFLEDYHDLVWDWDEYQKNIKRKLLGLVSFFLQHKIEFFFSGDLNHIAGIENIYPDIQDRIFKYHLSNKKYSDIMEISREQKIRISDDLPGVQDEHPGLYAHKVWGEEIAKFLENKYL